MVGQFQPTPRPADTDTKLDALKNLTGGVADIVGLTRDLFFDRPAFIASEEPLPPLGSAVRGLTRLNCRIWAARDKSNYSARVNAGNAALCGPYLNGLGEQPEDGELGAPFSGGQCSAGYVIELQRTDPEGGPPPNAPFKRFTFGPIVGTRSVPQDVDTVFLQVGSHGALLNTPNCQGGNPGSFRWTTIGTAPVGTQLLLLSIQACGADNCGDPPDVYRPPSTVYPPAPPNPDITVDVPGIGPVNVNVNLDPDGNPIICAPELDVCVTVEIDPDPVEPAPPGGGGPGPGDVGEPGGGGATGEGGDAEGQAPPGSVLTGLLMELVEAPETAKQYAPGIYRGGAYIYMGTDVGLDQDFAGSLLEDGQFVFAEKDNLTSWRVRANVGFNWNVTPYYREVEE